MARKAWAKAEDDRGQHEAMFDALSVSEKVDFGRQIAVLLDTGGIPHATQSRVAVRLVLDGLYTAKARR